MGSAWIVTHENTADLSETSHPKLFQRVQYGVRVICVGDVSARIGERRSKKKYRDIVGSKKRLEEVCEIVLDGELFFIGKERCSETSSSRRYLGYYSKSLRDSNAIFLRCER